MTLSDWMARTNTSAPDLARQVGVHWATIYKWRSHTAFPRVQQLAAIERATNGAVTAADFVPREPEAA